MLGFHHSYPYTPSLDPHSLAQKRRPPHHTAHPVGTRHSLFVPWPGLRFSPLSGLTGSPSMSSSAVSSRRPALMLKAKFLSSPWGWAACLRTAHTGQEQVHLQFGSSGHRPWQMPPAEWTYFPCPHDHTVDAMAPAATAEQCDTQDTYHDTQHIPGTQ